MKHRLKAAMLAAALCLTGACGCTASRQKTEYITKITVQQVAVEEVSYSQETINNAAQTLISAVDGAVTSVYGQNAKVVVADYEQLFYSVIESCEARRIAEEDMLLIVNSLCENSDLLVEFLTDKSSADYYSAAKLFAAVAAAAGTENACLLFYDISAAYCDFKYAQYYELYENYSYPYLLRYAQNWSQKKQSLYDIGEENFIYLLKISVSAVSIYSSDYSDGEQLLSGFSAGEAALFLRAQGYMSQKISLTAEGWNFVLTAAGESGISDKFTAIYKAGLIEEISPCFGAFFSNVADALTYTSSSCAEALTGGDFSSFLKQFLSAWSYGEWGDFNELLVCCQSCDFSAYFAKTGAEEGFEQFAQSVTYTTLGGLLQASDGEFYAAFKNYVATECCGLAYILFEL